MPQIIWRFALPLEEFAGGTKPIRIEIPTNAKPIHVAMYDLVPHFWAVVDPAHETKNIEIYLIDEGLEIPKDTKHLGSITLSEISYHFFWKNVLWDSPDKANNIKQMVVRPPIFQPTENINQVKERTT